MSTMGDDMKAMSHDDMKQPTSATKAMKMTMRQQMDTHMTALKERRTGAVGGRVQPFAH